MTTLDINFPQMEHDILQFWQEHDTFAQSLRQTQDKPIYTFYDGPPFATGLPHHGHLLASTLKDIIPRYFTMTGHYIERRFGWDCHGLPIEYEIDKQFGKSASEVVAEQGIASYNQACRNIVQRYASQWQKTITRIGRWVDFDHDYKTMDTDFMESVWWVFKQLWDKDLIYRGTKVVPFSTALQTALSNFEAGSNYQSVQDPAITVLVKLVDQPLYLAIWTTTPWTLPSNLGICINPDIDYVQVHDSERQLDFIMARPRYEEYAKQHPLELIATIDAQALVGQRYEPIFPYFADRAEQGAFRVFADEFVTLEDGTGLVHMAPAFGEDDHRVMQNVGVDPVCPVDYAGKFTTEVTDYAGQPVKEADKAIIKHLKTHGQLYEARTIVHNYPFCPRSDTPLIYRTIQSWYVKVESLKERMLAVNNQIHWVPEHIKHGRFGNWLAGARDWAISRSRVWGTPLPVWINDETDNVKCIGSIEELAQLSGQTVSDLHRDQVDPITFQLPGEAGNYRRIEEVLDCWFESGSMPYAQLHYPFANRERFTKGFPANFIAEGLDQTRGWFYTLTVLATALFDQPAFHNVIVNGIVMAEDGKKMSKRLRNYTSPDELMETYGADALRLYLINSGLVKAEEQRFTNHGVKDMVRRTLLPWYNAAKFLFTYAKVDQWNAQQHWQVSDNITDRWLYSRLQSIKAMIHEHMQQYRLYAVVPELLQFIDELTNCYIRLNRQRFWGEGLPADKCAAYTTLFTVIQEFTTCMAPFTPFLAEHLYQQLCQLSPSATELPDSVHLCSYPQADARWIDPPLEAAVTRMQQIILLGRQQRNEAKIKVKTPLRKLTVIHKDPDLLHDISQLADYLQQELNVKHIEYLSDEDRYIKLYAKPNSPVLGKRLGKRFKQYRQLIEALGSDQIERLEQGHSIQLMDETFTNDDVLIFREARIPATTQTNRFISIQLDLQLDEALIAEGIAREIVNRIQKSRKTLDFAVDDRIAIGFVTIDTQLQQVIAEHADYIMQETLAKQLTADKQMQSTALEHEIDGKTITFTLERVSHQ
jgi:isoleucyl-tRNA synthetase